MEIKFSYDKKGLTPDKYCRSASPVSAQSQILFVIYDLSEVSLQGSAAYQTAVDVCLCKQLGSAGSSYGSAVLDTDSCCGWIIIDLSDALTDCLTYFLCLLGSSYLASTDSPDRLVCDNQPLT